MYINPIESVDRQMSDQQSDKTGRAPWIVIPGGKDFPAKICTDRKREHETEIAVLYGDNGTELAQQIVAAMNTAVPELQALPKPLGYCIMADDGRMLWGENCIATDKSDLSGHLEIAQDDEPDDGWKIVPFYAAPLSASGSIDREALREAIGQAAYEWQQYVDTDHAPRTLVDHMEAAFDKAVSATGNRS